MSEKCHKRTHAIQQSDCYSIPSSARGRESQGEVFRLLGRTLHRPEDSVREHSLVAGVLPDCRFVAERRIEYPPLAVKSGPGERPTIESLMHTGLAKVHRALVEAQEHV